MLLSLCRTWWIRKLRRVDKRSLSASRGYGFNGLNPAPRNEQSLIKVVNRGTHVPRNKVKKIANVRKTSTVRHLNGQVFFTWPKGTELWRTKNRTSWNAGVGGNGLQSS